MTAKLNNEKLVQFTNELSLTDLEFILRVWKDRISIWNPNTRHQDSVDDIWINGTAVELGIAEEEIYPGETKVDLDSIKLDQGEKH